MGLFDFFELGFAAADAGGDKSDAVSNFEKDFSGEFSVVLGDYLQAYVLGGYQAHCFGDYLQFTFDWQALLKGLFNMIPGVGTLPGAMLFGQNGYTGMVFGQNTSLIYGINAEVKRAVTANVTGKNYLWDWFGGNFSPSSISGLAPPGGDQVNQETIDKYVGAICGILSALMVLAALVLDLVAAFKYPASTADQQLQQEFEDLATTPPKPGTNVWQELADSMNVPTGPAAMQELLKSISWTVTSRLAAIVIEVEQIGQALRTAVLNTTIATAIENTLKNGDIPVVVGAAAIAGTAVLAMTAAAAMVAGPPYLLYLGAKKALQALKEVEWTATKLRMLVLAVVAVVIGIVALVEKYK